MFSLVPSIKASINNKHAFIPGDTAHTFGEIAISDLAKDRITNVSFFVYSFTTTAMIAELRNNTFSATLDGKRLFEDRLSVNQANKTFAVSFSKLVATDSMTVRMFFHFKSNTESIIVCEDSVNITVDKTGMFLKINFL